MKNEQKFNTTNAKKVGLIAKDYPLFKQDLAKLEKILKKYNAEILLEKSCAKQVEKSGFELIKLAKECEFLITLGGDGTIISTCRKLAHISPLILGIHAGRLGFLTDITINESEKFFKDFFDDKFEVETPFMLDVTLHKNDGKTEKKIAFNDAVIVSKNGGSMTHIEALLNEKYFNSYYGDGVIVATPAGTTAYNMSANGPIIYPLSEVFALTPICSHSLTQRPVVLTKNHTVKFRTKSDAILVLDGQDRFDMSKISAVSMSLSDKKARLIRHIGRDYFQILKEKLHWGYND